MENCLILCILQKRTKNSLYSGETNRKHVLTKREDYPDHGVAFIADIAENGWGSPLEERWKTSLGRELLDYYKDRIPATFHQPLQ